jgi:NAD+ synthase (glutamine-hydrolysing)
MGLTYAELGDLGRLRKQAACGPYTTFCRLIQSWRGAGTPAEIAHKVYDAFLFLYKKKKVIFSDGFQFQG